MRIQKSDAAESCGSYWCFDYRALLDIILISDRVFTHVATESHAHTPNDHIPRLNKTILPSTPKDVNVCDPSENGPY